MTEQKKKYVQKIFVFVFVLFISRLLLFSVFFFVVDRFILYKTEQTKKKIIFTFTVILVNQFKTFIHHLID